MAIKRKRVLNQVFEVTPVSSNKKVKHVQPEKKLIKDEEDEVPLLVGSDEKPEALSEFSEGALHEELAAWSKLMVPTEVLRALKELNYTTPTAIQVAAIPVALRDRLDVLGAAETGSGKTLAFGIPLIHFITEEKRVDPIRKLRGLILTPTRELAVQIKRHIDQVAKYSDVTVSCVVGGLSVQKQERILRRSKPDIVVATPGRLWEMIESTNQEHLSKKSLRELKFLVIDEADRLTEKGHFEELTKVIEVMNNEEEDDIDENLEQLIDIKEVAYEDLDKWSDFGDDGVEEVSINGSDADEELSIASDDESEHSESDDEIHEVPKEDYDYGALKTSKTTIKRQILVFSATLTLIHDVPQRMKIETRKNKKRRQDFTVQGKLKQLMALVGMRPEASRVVDLTQNGSGRPNQEYLKEAVMMCAKEEKDMYLYYFLTLFPGRSIVFCNSKDCLRRLQNVLKILNMAPLTMHADMDQKHRLMALEKFTSVPGKGLLLASDVAARGLDISKVDHVLHYQCPRTAEGYVHRSGRTARAQTKGVTLIIVDPSEGYHYSKLCTSVNEGNHFASFPVEPSVFSVIKRRVELAQEIDIIDHRLKKTRSQSDWFKKAAREMDIDLEGRDDLFNHEREQPQTIANRKLLKGLQKQLNSLLKAPIGSHHRSTLEQLIKNPTASDELVSLVGNKTAIEAIEDVERKKPRKLDVARARPKKKEKKPRHVRKKPRN